MFASKSFKPFNVAQALHARRYPYSKATLGWLCAGFAREYSEATGCPTLLSPNSSPPVSLPRLEFSSDAAQEPPDEPDADRVEANRS